jgi:hypothetical protein
MKKLAMVEGQAVIMYAINRQRIVTISASTDNNHFNLYLLDFEI